MAQAEGSVTFNDGVDIDAAANAASSADYAVVFAGTLSHEGADRTSLSLDHGCVYSTDTSPGANDTQCQGTSPFYVPRQHPFLPQLVFIGWFQFPGVFYRTILRVAWKLTPLFQYGLRGSRQRLQTERTHQRRCQGPQTTQSINQNGAKSGFKMCCARGTDRGWGSEPKHVSNPVYIYI